AEGQALAGDRAALGAVVAGFQIGGVGTHHVAHAAAREVEEEILLVEVEEAVVEIDGLARCRVAYLDGVVAEALPVHLAGPVGDQRDLQVRPRRIGHAGPGRQQRARRRQPDQHPHSHGPPPHRRTPAPSGAGAAVSSVTIPASAARSRVAIPIPAACPPGVIPAKAGIHCFFTHAWFPYRWPAWRRSLRARDHAIRGWPIRSARPSMTDSISSMPFPGRWRVPW